MSFQIKWPTLDDETLEKIKAQITEAMNKGELPEAICDVMWVTQLDLGNIAPTLEFLAIPAVSEDRFEGHFKLAYSGNGSITLETKVQVNPFAAKAAGSIRALRHLGSLIAHRPTVVPLSITISQVRIEGELVLNIDKRAKPRTAEEKGKGKQQEEGKGEREQANSTKTTPKTAQHDNDDVDDHSTSTRPWVAARFKADPLQSVKISSSFDDFGSVKAYLQEQVEGSLRKLFVEDLPQIVNSINKPG